MEQRFVAIIEDEPCTFDAKKLIDAIDMADCYGHVQSVYLVKEDGDLQKLSIHGPWHSDDVLYIKVTDEKGETVADGYGTDH